MITKDTIIVAAKQQISSELSGEAVILDLHGGNYFGLDEIGARIWNLLQQPTTLAEIRDALLQEYDVTPERCEQEVKTLLEEMAAHHLIDVQTVSAS